MLGVLGGDVILLTGFPPLGRNPLGAPCFKEQDGPRPLATVYNRMIYTHSHETEAQ